MSLKALHVCFIVLSILLALGFGLWGVRDYSATGNSTRLFLGIVSFVGGGMLAVYLVWFLSKMKKVTS